jgi:hypothetical protein
MQALFTLWGTVGESPMAFVLSKDASYSRPVPFDVAVDGDEETGFEEQQITIRFKDMPRSWVLATVEKINAGEITDEEICRQVIQGWDGVEDERGKPVPFHAADLNELLEKRNFPGAAVGVFFDSLRGRKVKNSPTPQDTGSEPAA